MFSLFCIVDENFPDFMEGEAVGVACEGVCVCMRVCMRVEQDENAEV